MNHRPTSRIASRFAQLSLVAATAALLLPGAAQAVPSFARQTGLACEACHTVFPELTPFGRRFKLNGYTIDNLPQVSDQSTNKEQTLLLNQLPPLSFMLQASVTSTKKAVPDSAVAGANAQNGQTQFPQQASLFYAGRIAPNLGAFVQMTYDGTAGTFGWDNTDIRYAKNVNPNFLWGLSLNNNPTVQDVWNTTPAWQAPFDQRSATAPSGAAATMLDGGLADAGVAGLSVYGYWNDSLYAELGAYRSAPAVAIPLDSTNTSVVDGVAPYWRLAYERQWGRQSWEFGAYGVNAKMFPGGGIPLSGPTDRFNDVALDSQYQYIGDESIYSVLGTYIKESQTLDASNPGVNPDLKTLRVGGSYYYRRQYGAGLGYFSTTGSSDISATTDTTGWTAELDWIPYQNTKLALQYTAYNKFNGASDNYDGTGRNASDNNTLYLLGWINF
ncbi:MAG TPA: hypothetical protein VMV33_06040 [Rhodocyclaceae bacterium]|nr:hypothetical protein [Rhodocyclaceae bacterium]